MTVNGIGNYEADNVKDNNWYSECSWAPLKRIKRRGRHRFLYSEQSKERINFTMMAFCT